MKARSYLGTSGILWLLIIGLVVSACGTQGSPTVPEAPRLEQAALPSGSLVAWGDEWDDVGQLNDTPTGTGFVAVAAGGYHNVALRSDGSLVSWGNNWNGQVSNTPTGTGFVAVAGGGVHSVALRSDGSLVSWGNNDLGQVSDTPTGTGFVAVAAGLYHSVAIQSAPPADTTPPTITLTTPADGATYLLNEVVHADYSCEDEEGGSGLASCEGTVAHGAAIDTGSVGSKSFSVDAADNAGNTNPLAHGYSVVYDFSGFLQPVDKLPTVNRVKAGQGVPVRFSLSGNQGLGILAAGFPKSAQISCNFTNGVDDVTETVTAGSSSLSYDAAADRYTYVWKTEKSWAGSCRQLTLKFIDGQEYKANFNFTK
jgi:hypothetical protein